MNPFSDAWNEEQRRRRIRPNAHLWIAANPERFGPLDPEVKRILDEQYEFKQGRSSAQCREGEAAEPTERDAQRRALIERIRAENEVLRDEIQAMKAALLGAKANFNPAQPRDELGRWTDTGGGHRYTPPASKPINDPRVISDATPDDVFQPGTRLAANDRSAGYPVNLLEERALGGHAIEGHVGKSEDALLARLRRDADAVRQRGDSAEGLRVGSFSSLEAANKLINSTIRQNSAKVERIVSGLSPQERLEAQFDTPTGREAFMQSDHSRPIIRDTYGVRVIIIPDGRAGKGYRVDTAFPANFKR